MVIFSAGSEESKTDLNSWSQAQSALSFGCKFWVICKDSNSLGPLNLSRRRP